jgi:hypothetical protein
MTVKMPPNWHVTPLLEPSKCLVGHHGIGLPNALTGRSPAGTTGLYPWDFGAGGSHSSMWVSFPGGGVHRERTAPGMAPLLLSWLAVAPTWGPPRGSESQCGPSLAHKFDVS